MPTRLGNQAETVAPAVPTQRIGPTALKGIDTMPSKTQAAPEKASDQVQPSVFKPTALHVTAAQAPVETDQAPTAPSTPIKPVALPGVQRKTVDVSVEDLIEMFPKYSRLACERARAILSGFSVDSANPTTVLVFGKEPQEELAVITRGRLSFAQRPGVRYVVQHLSRLQILLQELLDAFEGGFLRKSPDKIWNMHRAEIELLESALDEADDKLAGDVGEFSAMKAACERCLAELGATALAAEYLSNRLREDLAGLMLSRMASITASQAMVIDQMNLIEREAEQLQELTLLVQDGVVLKLPSVYSQLASLNGRINDTERFHAVERLNDILNPLKARKIV